MNDAETTLAILQAKSVWTYLIVGDVELYKVGARVGKNARIISVDLENKTYTVGIYATQ